MYLYNIILNKNFMTWFEILTWIIGSGGIAGFFHSLYTAKANKKKIHVETTQLLNDEWESLFNKLKIDTNERINSLEIKICKLELKDDLKTKAINQFIKCTFTKKGNNCPVATFMESADEILQRKLTPKQLAELNKDGKNS